MPSDLLDQVADAKFAEDKQAIVHELCSNLDENDRSRKGSFDSEIAEVLSFLNNIPVFASTSSCSGRIVMYSRVGEGKGNCRWHLVCHSEFSQELLVNAIEKVSGEEPRQDVFLKFEPFILHIRCRSLSDAQKLHIISTQSGLRNSGITVRRKGKEGFGINLAIRCTLNFEMPVFLNGIRIIQDAHVPSIADLLQDKMHRNLDLIARFYAALKENYCAE